MAGFDDVATPTAPQSGGGFDAVATPFNSGIPDMSGVRKMAQENLAANDNKDAGGEPKPPQTPQERLNIALGKPMETALKGAPLTPDERELLIKHYNNGTASSVSDFMQTSLPAVAHSAIGVPYPDADATWTPKTDQYGKIESTVAMLGSALQKTAGVAARGAGEILGAPFGQPVNPLTDIADVLENIEHIPPQQEAEHPIISEATQTAAGLVPALLGPAAVPFFGAQGAGQESEAAQRAGATPEQISKARASGFLSGAGSMALMEKLPMMKSIERESPGFTPWASAKIQQAVYSGITFSTLGEAQAWLSAQIQKQYNPKAEYSVDPVRTASAIITGGLFGALVRSPLKVDGHEELKEPVGKILDKPPETVTPDDINQTIHAGYKDAKPNPGDFKAVDTVTNGALNEKTLEVVFKKTGKTPDEVYHDAQSDPEITESVQKGAVPEAYKPLEAPSKAPAEKLTVAPDAATRSFSVVDAEGDHVSGGFDSAEEARHYIEDEKFKAEERAAIQEEGKAKPEPTTEKTPAGEQQVIPGAEKIGDKELAERKMQAPLKGGNEPVGGLFGDEHKQGDLLNQPVKAVEKPAEPATIEKTFAQKPNFSYPSESGKVTTLKSFLKNNGAKINENNELVSIKRNGEVIKGEGALEYAHEIAKEQGYLPKDKPNEPPKPITDLQNALTSGKDIIRSQDEARDAKYKESDAYRKNLDEEANRAGLDTTQKKGESNKKWAERIHKELSEFYKSEAGAGMTPRAMIGETIKAAEKFTGKLTGDFFKKLGDAYIRTFQPELVGPLAKRADAFLAKYKAAGQQAEHAFYQQSKAEMRRWDKMSSEERMNWLNDHETGRWNEEDDPDHARFQALLDATFHAEKESIGADAEKGYKENYLPHSWEKPDEVLKYFNSDAYIKKYGKDGFTKRSTFQLIQDGVRAGFKLKTDNPERMLVARLLAGDSMIRTMDLLHDMEGSGIATRATAFSVDKKISKTQTVIDELKEKYKKEFEDIEKQKSLIDENGKPIGEPVSKHMMNVQDRLADLNKRLEDFKAEKAANKLTPEQMKDLKGGFRIIGPDSHAWNIHQEAGPLWKNAMEMKGLWENQGVTGDAYRSYMQGKAIWTQVKLGLSLFHPVHVAMIDLASHIAATADHLIQGGKLSDLALKEPTGTIGIGRETLKGQDHPAVQAWNTAPEARTPEQHQMVSRMVEGGFKPTMSARDTIHFKENFDKAIAGVGLNNLRLLGTAVSLPGLIMKPFFEHWIPGMKSEIYLRRYQDALDRDPSLSQDAGRRAEMARQIAKDTDRTYGEMNNSVQFWNKNIRDSFNAAFISGGWKLAQIYNAKGLLQPGKIAYKYAKTGEFSKADITYNMLHAYAYTGLTLALGGAINAILGNPIGTAKDTVWDIVKNLVAPQTGEKNPDGTPIRLNQPAFAKEWYNIAHEINTKGIVAGSGSFLYHQTLIPGIVNTLTNRDFVGRTEISDPTDLHQWMHAGWDSINPISLANLEKAETKHSEVGKVAGALGFPIAGAYLNQTPFEQRVIAKYDEQNPPKGDAYQAKLKADLKGAIASKDTTNEAAIEGRMKEEGMTEHEIASAKKTYKEPFAEHAWKELRPEDQKHLIESASEEEKKKYKVKSQ